MAPIEKPQFTSLHLRVHIVRRVQGFLPSKMIFGEEILQAQPVLCSCFASSFLSQLPPASAYRAASARLSTLENDFRRGNFVPRKRASPQFTLRK